MQSKLYWLIPAKILYWELAGSISASEICEMSRFISSTVNKNPAVQRVHLLIDATGITMLNPNNVKARSEFAVLAKERWMGQVVVIVRNIQIQIHLNAMSSAFGMNWTSVPSMRHAIRSLQQSDHMVNGIPDVKLASLIERSVFANE